MPGTMGIIGWIIIGGLAGWIASKFMNTDAQMGLVANVVVGIIGGLLGGWVLSIIPGLNVAGGGMIFSFITAVLGACILLAILKAVMGGRKRV